MNFLETITSRNGRNLITGPHKTKTHENGQVMWVQQWVDFADHAATERAIDRVQEEASGVYFALGAFDPDENGRWRRKQVQCRALRAFWLDIDAGPEKYTKHNGVGVYRTAQDAAHALKAFLHKAELPSPTHIVSSGHGLHVYWAVDADIEALDWRVYSRVLRSACQHYGLLDDPSRTTDVASVLRPPGTLHHSGNMVELRFESAPLPKQEFLDHLTRLRGEVPQIETGRISQPPPALMGEKPAWLNLEGSTMLELIDESTNKFFQHIITKSEMGMGCGQMMYAYTHQAEIEEPRWAACLSIVKHCEDADEWAVKISEEHPQFDRATTLTKMHQWDGPRTCAWFRSSYPEQCQGCPNNNLTSPIQLGENDGRAPVQIEAPREVVNPTTGLTELKVEQFVIPPYPFPFYRHPDGGICIEKPKEGEDGKERDPDGDKISNVDFYLVDRVQVADASREQRLWFRAHTPNDGVVDIDYTPAEVTSTGSTLRASLGEAHVWVNPKDTNFMSLYLAKTLQDATKARAQLQAPSQMGWTADDTFVWGGVEYTPTGPRPVPVSKTVLGSRFSEAVVPSMARSPEVLREFTETLADMYGHDDAATYRMIISAVLGAPIRSRFGSDVERGGLMNIYSEASGLGKSTAIYTALRFFGNPRVFSVNGTQGATSNAFFLSMAYVNSVPMLFDEIGGMPVEDLMAFVHDTTRGTERQRAQGSSNDLRATNNGWHSFTVSTSNRSIWDMISTARVENEAYLMRVMELTVKPIRAVMDDPVAAGEVARRMEAMHGIAAPYYLEHLVKAQGVLEDRWLEARAGVVSACMLNSKMRYWANMAASAVIGAQIGYECGVSPFDPEEVKHTTYGLINAMRTRVASKIKSDDTLLADFINNNLSAIVIVHSPNANSIKAPLHRVSVRLEVEANRMWLDPNALADFAQHRGFNLERMEAALEDLGAKRGVLKRMLDNTDRSSVSPPIRAWEIDCRDPRAARIFDVATLAAHGEENA